MAATAGESQATMGSRPGPHWTPNFRERFLIPLLFFVGIVGAWEGTVRVFSVPNYLLPTPSEIIVSFPHGLSQQLHHARATLTEAFLGYVIGNGIGFLFAAFMAEFRILELGLYPYLVAFRSLPIVAVAPLLIIWFGFTIWPVVSVAALLCFFPTLVNGIQGFKATDQTTMELMRGLNANRRQIFRHVKLYNALPYIFAALKISVASALIGAIIGEWLAADKGLGYLTILANNYVDTLLLFRTMIMISLIGITWFLLLVLLERRILSWRNGEGS